jgi:hypothetical protein
MPFGGRAVAASAPLTSLDALAESLAARGTPGEPPALFRWDEHQARPSRAAAQRAFPSLHVLTLALALNAERARAALRQRCGAEGGADAPQPLPGGQDARGRRAGGAAYRPSGGASLIQRAQLPRRGRRALLQPSKARAPSDGRTGDAAHSRERGADTHAGPASPARRDDGVALSTAEAELKALLEAHGLLSPARDGRCAPKSPLAVKRESV